MIPKSYIAIVVLIGILLLAGYEIKRSWQANAKLSQTVEARDESIKRLSDQATLAEAERKRLDQIILVRDTIKQDNEGRANAGKTVVRVASQQPTRFGDCSRVLVPADIVERLRSQATDRSADDQAIPAVKPAKRVSATYYSQQYDYRAGDIVTF